MIVGGGPCSPCGFGGSDRKGTAKHGIGVEALKQLPARLRDPLMIFDSATQPDSLVALMDMTVKGKKVVAAVHLGKKAGRYDVNSIANVHGRDDAEVVFG